MNTQAADNVNPYSNAAVTLASTGVSAPAQNAGSPIAPSRSPAEGWAVVGLLIALLIAGSYGPTSKGAIAFGTLLLAIVWISVWQEHNAGTLTPFSMGS